MFEFNLFAVVRMVRAAIVNVSSGNGRRPGPMNHDYNAAKAAPNNPTKGLSEEYAPQGVQVNSVSPGMRRVPVSSVGVGAHLWMTMRRSPFSAGRMLG